MRREILKAGQSWQQALQNELERAIGILPGNLRGMIICGPLAPHALPPWVHHLCQELERCGLDLSLPYNSPRLNGLWLCSDREDPIASGAAIYGQRVLNSEPTYLDTLPHLSIFAIESGKSNWIPLVDAYEIDGNETYENQINGKFKLSRDSSSLDIFLKKDDLSSKIPQKKGQVDTTYEIIQEKIKPYRKANIPFPVAPREDVALNLIVRMRPASGRAQVEIISRDPAFLRGRKIFLDYSTMFSASDEELPKFKRGWPEIEEIAIDPKDGWLDDARVVIDDFCRVDPLSSEYPDTLDKLKAVFIRTSTIISNGKQVHSSIQKIETMRSCSRKQLIVYEWQKLILPGVTRAEPL